MKLTITKVFRSEKDKNGGWLQTKDGRMYEKVAIKTKEYGDKWVSGFGRPDNKSWKEGDVVDIEVTENGQYLNFKMPPRMVSRQEFDELVVRVKKLENWQVGEKQESPQEDLDVESPF